ncbi:MAG: peptidoglycan editing factor PgeF [Lachnospiraceae bacterium]|nr:peptidoglycan editing factor PgeF [Lachnospiraceae bacterium]
MILHTDGQVKYLSFKSLDDLGCVRNYFTTRTGGVSTGYHSSMNLSFTNGDDPENIYRNFDIISEVVGVACDHMVRTHQTHTTNVMRVTEEHVFDDGRLHDQEWSDVDGLMTDVPGIALVTFYADCVPLYFVDPVRRTIALSHSGWRGTAAGMAKVTVEGMCREFGTDPSDIYAAIGPSICKDHYEVSEVVADAFRRAFPDSYPGMLENGKEPGKYQLDLCEANRQYMIQAGIPGDHIEVSGMCTFSERELFFSHRASDGKRGNMAAFLVLEQ